MSHSFQRRFLAFCLSLTAGALALGMSPAAWAYDLHDNAILHADNGQLLMERQQYAQAIEEFKAALQLNPYTNMSASIYNNLGLAYRELHNYPYAYASFQRACRIQPTFSLYYKNLIETYAQAGALSNVKRELQAAIQRDSGDAEAWFMLGLLYKEQGSRKAAKACFERFVKLEPESEMARAARNAL